MAEYDISSISYGGNTYNFLGGGSGGVDTTAAHYLGVTTTAITDGSSTSTISIDGQSHTAANGDIVSYNGTKFVYDSDAGEWSVLGSGGGSSNTDAVTLTQAEYDALPSSQKLNGTIYFVYTPDHIEITTPPTKTAYHGNDCEFDSTGLVVSFVTNEGSTITDVTSLVTLNMEDGDWLTIPDGESSQDYTITASYSSSGHTYTASFTVTAYET